MRYSASLMLLIAMVSCHDAVFGQVPRTLSYQGVLSDSSGRPLPDGQYQMSFRLFAQASGTASLWEELHTVVVEDGVFSAILGSVRPFNLAFDKPYWLEIGVKGDVLSPRTELTASAYSLNTAGIPDSIVTSAKIAKGQVVRSINGLKDAVRIAAGPNVIVSPQGDSLVIGAVVSGGSGPWQVSGNSTYYNLGRVGIGTANPAEQLEITRNFRLPATTTNGTAGVIIADSSRFIHSYGRDNFFAGRDAGNFTMTGPENTGIGKEVLRDNTLGRQNTALGAGALSSNTTGNYNTAIGISTLPLNTQGTDNVAIGRGALSGNTTGSNNTAVGTSTFFGSQNGNYNTAIGFAATAAPNLTNATAIGAQAGVTASNTIQLGNTSVTDVITSGRISAAGFVGDGSGLTNLPSNSWQIIGTNRYQLGGSGIISNSGSNSGLTIDQTSTTGLGSALWINHAQGASDAVKIQGASGSGNGLSVIKEGGSGHAIEARNSHGAGGIHVVQWGAGVGIRIDDVGSADRTGYMLDIEKTIGGDPLGPGAIRIVTRGEDILNGYVHHDDPNSLPYSDVATIAVYTNLTKRPAVSVTNYGVEPWGEVARFRIENVAENSKILRLLGEGNPEVSSFRFIEAVGNDSDVKFRVDGDGRAYSDEGFTGNGADFAEMVEVEGGYLSAEPGDVMVISSNNDRAMQKSTGARSTLVMGIYSAKPGFVGSERSWDVPVGGEEKAKTLDAEYMKEIFNEVPLAVVGIVPCKVSAENGPIRRGDLLVTSSTPGHAMRDDEPKNGTVLGKALGSLDSGTGIIKVLVSLQ